jgi:uncharacterized protein (DUF1778 family)
MPQKLGINIRLTEAEHAFLLAAAEARGVSLTKLISTAALASARKVLEAKPGQAGDAESHG